MSLNQDVLLGGAGILVGSQIFTRLATFSLNQIVTRLLSVEAFGLMAVRFHLINTSILMLSREGLRRGCLRSQQGLNTRALLELSSLCLPLGFVVTLFACWFFGPQSADDLPGYRTSVILQGVAALIELVSEPMYILAQARLLFGLRVRIEAAAMTIRVLATISLLRMQLFTEPVALSVAQIIYAVVTVVGYAWYFLGQSFRTANKQSGDRPKEQVGAMSGSIKLEDVLYCCNFTGQAFEKLILAEGTKIAMAKVQGAYDQGVYGLVVNLGSLVVRTLFQPVEEAAFIAFSRGPEECQHKERLATLLPLIRSAVLFGLVIAAFGPSNTYLLLHLLYGAKYSSTEAPAALALYCLYILLLATNGILESYVHAVARGPELVHGHIALLLITAVQMGATLLLVAARGTLGMIAADASGMLLRIAYCLWFVASQSRCNSQTLAKPTGTKTFDGKDRRNLRSELESGTWQLLRQALPSGLSLLILAVCAILSAASAAACCGKGLLSLWIDNFAVGFWRGAAVHVVLESIILVCVLVALCRTERSLWRAFREVKQKRS